MDELNVYEAMQDKACHSGIQRAMKYTGDTVSLNDNTLRRKIGEFRREFGKSKRSQDYQIIQFFLWCAPNEQMRGLLGYFGDEQGWVWPPQMARALAGRMHRGSLTMAEFIRAWKHAAGYPEGVG